MSDDLYMRPSQDMYEDWQYIYDFFNERLFDFELPNALVMLQRRNGTFGYYRREAFHTGDGKFTDEIALNPSLYDPNNPIGMLSTLVHEKVHLWQYRFGTPGKRHYHNREFANKMRNLGLQPTADGKPGGRETGYSMHHLIVPDGPFERAARELLENRVIVRWTECPPEEPYVSLKSVISDTLAESEEIESDGVEGTQENAAPNAATKNASKNGKRWRYECPEFEDCKEAFDGKFGLNQKCIKHDLKMVTVERKKRQPGEGLPLYQVAEN